MDAALFRTLVGELTVGKKLPDAIYVHDSTMPQLPEKLRNVILAIGKALKIPREQWNLIKLSRKQFSLSLLHYPSFEEESYPALKQSVTVDLQKLTHKVTDYTNYDNPPILHRKETMVLPGHPQYEEFKQITEEGEQAGLYENSRHMGLKHHGKL